MMGGRNRSTGSKPSDGTLERGSLYCIVAGLLVVAALHLGPRLAPRHGASARADLRPAGRASAAPADPERARRRPVPADFTAEVPLRAERARPPEPEPEPEPRRSR